MARESSPPDKSGNRPAICPVVIRQAYGCVDVGDHSLKGQRMAPHTPQESPKVKTMCSNSAHPSLRSHGPPCPAPVRPLVEH